MLNTTPSISTPWKAIKFFLDEFTVKKINILSKPVPEDLFTHANKE